MRRSDFRSAVSRYGDRNTASHASSARRLREAGVINGLLDPLLVGVVKKFSSSAEAGGASRTESISIMFSSLFLFPSVAMYDLDNTLDNGYDH